MEAYKTKEQLLEESNENRFKIRTPKEAEWAIKKIKEAETDTAFWTEHYKKQLELVTKANDATIEIMTMYLNEYFETLPKRETKTQYVYDGLPSAKLVRKKPAVKLVPDKGALLAFLKEKKKDEFIKVEESPMWGEFKKSIEEVNGLVVDRETKEIVKGVTVENVPAEFVVKLEG